MKALARPLEVKKIFDAYPKQVRLKLEELRHLILTTAAKTEEVGPLEETLKWHQPSYLTSQSKSGTTIRIDQVKSDPEHYALYVNCQTSLTATYRELYGNKLNIDGKRALLFDVKEELPEDIVQHCIELALTYHVRKRKDHLPF